MRRLMVVLFIMAVLVAALPLAAYAIADPDSAPSVSAISVYEDLIEDGDAGVLVDYTLDYAVPPSETAREAYFAIFIDTDGATQLKTVAPYPYHTSGYGHGVIWIYFTADEVTTYGIDRTNEALYEVWLTGNPTLTWTPGPNPPKTTAGIDYWQPADSSAPTLLSLKVLSYADILALDWSMDLIERTAVGNRLTTAGETYFENAIPNLRDMAPDAFSVGMVSPTIEDLDYDIVFGATMTNGTGAVTGSPITLTEGANTVDVTGNGTFTMELAKGVTGTVADVTANVTGSPVAIVYGSNTITATGLGDLLVTVTVTNTQSSITGTVTGTALDLSEAANAFGMSTIMFSGLVWLAVSIIICAGAYQATSRSGGGGGKVVMIVFDICIIGGALLGLMSVLIATLLFIGFGAVTAFVLIYKGAYY